MKVVILCGGKGMRLREETEHKPKPLVTIGEMPILWHIMKTYAHYGFRDFVLCLGYKGEMIKDYFLGLDEAANDFTLKLGSGPKVITHHNKRGLADDWNITFVNTGLNSNTGSRLAKIKDFIGNDEEFLLTYGDGVADIDINAAVAYHKQKGKVATLSGVNWINPFGVIEPQDGLVAAFKEKPRSKAFINGGFYILNKKVFDYVKKDEDCILEKEPMEKLSREGQLAIYEHHGFWYCVDTMKHLEDLNVMYASGNRPWMVWENKTTEV
ncbi:MAG: glucose-1-phosphate cytidylyltransferase [bacterium]|nr:glucose-1-phosphate cytidylyltransferase [bacterium]